MNKRKTALISVLTGLALNCPSLDVTIDTLVRYRNVGSIQWE